MFTEIQNSSVNGSVACLSDQPVSFMDPAILGDRIMGFTSHSAAVESYDEEHFQRLRQFASDELQRAHDLREQAHHAHQSGDITQAKELSALARKYSTSGAKYNEEAARYAFSEANRDVARDEINLHGLYVNEALACLEARIRRSVAQRQNYLQIIVGKGNHSKDNIAKIKPAVESYCDRRNLEYRVMPENTGIIVVHIPPDTFLPQPQESQGVEKPVKVPEPAHPGFFYFLTSIFTDCC